MEKYESCVKLPKPFPLLMLTVAMAALLLSICLNWKANTVFWGEGGGGGDVFKLPQTFSLWCSPWPVSSLWSTQGWSLIWVSWVMLFARKPFSQIFEQISMKYIICWQKLPNTIAVTVLLGVSAPMMLMMTMTLALVMIMLWWWCPAALKSWNGPSKVCPQRTL